MTIGKTPTNYQQRVGTAARDTLGKRWVRWANPSIRPEGDVDERQHCLLPGVSRETHVESLRIRLRQGQMREVPPGETPTSFQNLNCSDLRGYRESPECYLLGSCYHVGTATKNLEGGIRVLGQLSLGDEKRIGRRHTTQPQPRPRSEMIRVSISGKWAAGQGEWAPRPRDRHSLGYSSVPAEGRRGHG